VCYINYERKYTSYTNHVSYTIVSAPPLREKNWNTHLYHQPGSFTAVVRFENLAILCDKYNILVTIHKLQKFPMLQLDIHCTNVDVLLTVYLSIFISVFNQLDAQNLFHTKFYFMPLHVFETCRGMK